jgi:hypothetical protein
MTYHELWTHDQSLAGEVDGGAFAGMLSLDNVKLGCDVDASTPTLAVVEPFMTFRNRASLALTYSVESLSVSVNDQTVVVEPPGPLTLAPDTTDDLRTVSFANQSVGVPLRVRLRYVLIYGPVGRRPVARATRTVTYQPTVIGDGSATFEHWTVEDSSETILDSQTKSTSAAVSTKRPL